MPLFYIFYIRMWEQSSDLSGQLPIGNAIAGLVKKYARKRKKFRQTQQYNTKYTFIYTEHFPTTTSPLQNYYNTVAPN